MRAVKFTEESAGRIASTVHQVERMSLPNNNYRRRQANADGESDFNPYQGLWNVQFLGADLHLPTDATINEGLFISGSFSEVIATDTLSIDSGSKYLIARFYYTSSLQHEFLISNTLTPDGTITVGGSSYYKYDRIIGEIIFESDGAGQFVADFYQYLQGPLEVVGRLQIS